MSDEEERLIAAIVEAPDDDAPRLVYADWLQSRGDPRGELIQLQCQLAAVPDDERRRAIKIVENKLLGEHSPKWLQPLYDVLPRPVAHAPYKFEFVRGFVEAATLTLEAMRHLDRVFAVAPLLRRLEIIWGASIGTRLPQPSLGRLLDAPQLARLRALEVNLTGGGNAIAEAVAAATTLGELCELTIHASVWGETASWFDEPLEQLVLDDIGARALARSAHLAKLERLDLESNRLATAGVQALAMGPWRLRELVLSHNAIDDFPAAGKAIVEALGRPAFSDLEVLGLGSTPFDDKSLAALVRGPHLAKLRELDLEKSHLGATGAAALCKAFALPALRRLRLERNSLCDAGAFAIADCAALANLTSFEAGHNRIGQKGGTALATTPHFRNLERLTLNEPRWKPEMTAVFADSPTLANAKIYLAGRLVGRKKTKPGVTKPGVMTTAATTGTLRAAESAKPKRATGTGSRTATSPTKPTKPAVKRATPAKSARAPTRKPTKRST